MFLTKNNGLHELNDSDRRIIGVFPSSDGSFPFICYEDNFSRVNTITNTREIEFAYLNDTNLSGIEKEFHTK